MQLLISAQDVENYKVIKSELDRLRTMVEKSELWVDKKGSGKGEEVEAGAAKDKKEVCGVREWGQGPREGWAWLTPLPVPPAARGRGGLSAPAWGEEQRELPDRQRREWPGPWAWVCGPASSASAPRRLGRYPPAFLEC